MEMQILKDYLEKHSIKKDNHVLWNRMNVIKQTPEPCEIITIARKLNLPKQSYSPQELFLLYNGITVKTNARLRRICELVNCIAHYEQVQHSLVSVVQMDAFDYDINCHRFAKKCSPQNPITKCIDWNGYIHDGYGRCVFLGHSRSAHAVAFELANCIDVPKDMVVRHLCETKNRRCVFEEHLKLGTHAENAQDEVDGGYKLVGIDSPNAIISEEMAQAIIDSLEKGGSKKERALNLSVSYDIVHDIDRARSWRHLMTPSQISAREASCKKRKKSNLSEQDVKEIKESSEPLATLKKKYNTSLSMLGRVRSGTYTSPETKKLMYFRTFIQKISDCSLCFVDTVNQSTHLLFNGNKSTNSKDFISQKISYFGKQEYVARASYMAHHQIQSIPKGQIIRHKCLYKYCVNIDCLETGSYLDNAHDKLRDGTMMIGENSPFAKITSKLAMEIKQTKGVGLQKDRSCFFGVSIGIISAIDHERAWKHLIVKTVDSALIARLTQFVQNKNP